ncbi:hypothetical protein D3C80_1819510 [compost metagenome]
MPEPDLCDSCALFSLQASIFLVSLDKAAARRKAAGGMEHRQVPTRPRGHAGMGSGSGWGMPLGRTLPLGAELLGSHLICNDIYIDFPTWVGSI